MKINFERTGGFTGMKLALNLDLDNLLPVDAAALRKLVDEADYFDLQVSIAPDNLRDGFQYNITVEGENESRTLQVSDGSIPDKLLPLINDLSMRARSNRR